MAEVNHHTHTIHLFNDFRPKLTHTMMLVIASCRVTDVVVAIVAEGHINDTTFAESFHITDVLANRITILDTQHNGLLALLLQSPEVIRRVGNIHSRTVLGCHLLNLRKNLIGFGSSVLQRCFITLLLL